MGQHKTEQSVRSASTIGGVPVGKGEQGEVVIMKGTTLGEEISVVSDLESIP